MSRGKTHFTDEQWADFVNRQSPPEQAQEMRDHLSTGCGSCSDCVEFWQRVRGIAALEGEYHPPESVVRHVQQAFSQVKFTLADRGKFEVPHLFFDSLWQPASAGLRSAANAPRQIFYRLRNIAIEMQLEPDLKSERMNLIGQISFGGHDENLAGISVVVRRLNGDQQETRTNEFGEFQLAYLPEKGIQIVFSAGNHKDLLVLLDSEASDLRPNGADIF